MVKINISMQPYFKSLLTRGLSFFEQNPHFKLNKMHF